ncbi:hypothetical protein [Acinetobacter larvae]|uniref:Defence against restriction A N-terminal domain-containing protein n=1 Tax=Acinetobacter larvae TaxID=1789224 RepID=A0A1B2LZD4_9GAMM|nr:hypothetical protein [Acinetobacter larvae]AOA58296.1 hypothetical protein BFG52_07940 [Acinetobacter larvae]
MNNLISAQEAFNAVMSGKHVLCRAAGEMLEFDDLDQFPATIFAKSGYEFCIKIETIEIAGITFTKPLTFDEIVEGQEIYIVNTHDTSIHISEFNKATFSKLVKAINSGFAQRDEDNAKRQLQAFSRVLGRELVGDCPVVRLDDEKPKQTRKPRVKKEAAQTAISDAQDTTSTDAAIESLKAAEPDAVTITAVGDTVVKTDNLIDFSNNKDEIKILRERIAAATSVEELEALLPDLRNLHGEQGHLLMTTYDERKKVLASISDELNPLNIAKQIKADVAKASSKDELERLKNSVAQSRMFTNSILKDLEDAFDEREYQIKLDDLLVDVVNAQTPTEANAPVRYTTAWSEEQRKPLLVAISKRLSQFEQSVSSEAPSLMRDIQNAADLTALDALEIDISARAPDMQKKLMAEVYKRRAALEREHEV